MRRCGRLLGCFAGGALLVMGTGSAWGAGLIVAWGANDCGQCNVPAPNSGFVAVAGGGGHSLGLRSDGSIAAWGCNDHGQCNVPAPNSGFVAVAAGYSHSLGLKGGGSVVAWGWNAAGQCNVPPYTDFVAIAAGDAHSAGLRSGGSVVVWGECEDNQCAVPSPNLGFVDIASGFDHCLGLKNNDGSIVAWGMNDFGQCNVPSPNTGFEAMAAGESHSLGLRAGNSIAAWGDNSRGQCSVPAPNQGFVAVGAGRYHSLGLRSDGPIAAWGANDCGQCDVPAPNSEFVGIAAGYWHSVGIRGEADSPATPTLGSLTPSSGVLQPGVKATLVAQYSDANGYADLAECRLLINTGLSGANSVYLMYNETQGKLYVRNDANTAWLGGFAPGSANVIENSYCRLYCAETMTTGDGWKLTVSWRLEPKAAMSPRSCKAWMYATDDAGRYAGWAQTGAFTIDQPPVDVGVSPNSGTLPTVVKRTFVATYSDADGVANLAEGRLILRRTSDGLDVLHVKYDANANLLYLRKIDNSGWLGGFPPGSANVIDNTLFKLYCANSAKSESGISLKVSLSVEPNATMAGKSCTEWMYCADDWGLYDGWEQMGAISFNGPPVDVSISPNSGIVPTGAKRTFVATYSDADGLPNLAEGRLVLRRTLDGLDVLHVRYDANADLLYLRKIDQSGWLGGFPPGSANVIDNGLFKLYCANSTKSDSGSSLKVSLSVEPNATMAGKSCTEWMYCADDWRLYDGWEQMGAISFSGPPVDVSISPNSGIVPTSAESTFAAAYSDPNGAADIAEGRLILKRTSDGLDVLHVKYDANADLLYLRKIDKSGWLGGFPPGSANVIDNTLFKVYCGNSTKSGSGNSLTLNLSVEPNETMAGKSCTEWMYCADDWGLYDGWEQTGTVDFFTTDSAPRNLYTDPSDMEGTVVWTEGKQAFLAAYSDPDGYADLAECRLILKTTDTKLDVLHVRYDANANLLYVRKVGCSDWYTPKSPGSADVLDNGYFKLYCAESSFSEGELRLGIEAKRSMAGKTCSEWMYCRDDEGLYDGWEQTGWIDFFSREAPANVSFSPNSGSVPTGAIVAFVAVFSDANGGRCLADCRVILKAADTNLDVLHVRYDPDADLLYVRRVGSSDWYAAKPPGSADVLDNGYFKLHCAGCSKSVSGNTLTLNLPIEANPTMAGKTCSEWMYCRDYWGPYDGWEQMGTISFSP